MSELHCVGDYLIDNAIEEDSGWGRKRAGSSGYSKWGTGGIDNLAPAAPDVAT
jgi:hypothetical protein